MVLVGSPAGYEDTNDAERLAEDPTFRDGRDLDIDSSESPVHARKSSRRTRVTSCPSAITASLPLRPGNVHNADGWGEALLPIIDRSQARGQTLVVRADAAFALPPLYEALERRGVRHAIRLPANDVLERAIENLLTRHAVDQVTPR